jgi:hypothetical protein
MMSVNVPPRSTQKSHGSSGAAEFMAVSSMIGGIDQQHR